MDIQPQTQQPISDDQELAKVLAGITQQADAPATAVAEEPEAPVEETPVEVAAPVEEPVIPTIQAPVEPTGDLNSIKTEALSELRPLVDKLNVEPEEKFDTYLLLLRSTDDKSLIAPAHEAARNIADEARRAQALLDIIKEIDYLSNGQQQAA
jgi:hypothetical protein